MFACPDRWEDANQRQVPRGLHRPPAAGAGEGVPLQQVHHHPEEGGAGHSAQPIRETGKERKGALFHDQKVSVVMLNTNMQFNITTLLY